MLKKRLVVFAAAMAVAGCALDQQAAPPLSGPSELGLSLEITASPDNIMQDGASQSVVEVIARDSVSQPARGVTFVVETTVGGTPVDFGSLSSKTISTNGDGRATVVYRSPDAPPAGAPSDQVVSIQFTPVGTNYSNALARNVEIRLRRPGVILPPNGTPVPEFFFSPANPRENDEVIFDASASTDSDGQIVSYVWNFGDSNTGSGVRAAHHYDVAGTYNVTLTVTDDRGQKATSAPKAVTVGTSQAPTAAFAVSPANPGVGTLVTVNASGSQPSTGRVIVDYDWDFGDGTPHEKGLTASHTYTTAGAYVIVLRVTDDAGKTASSTAQITVGNLLPSPSFTFSPSGPTTATVVNFNASASTVSPGRTIAEYAWDFGDGAPGVTGQTVQHTFAAAGTYTVTLRVTDNTGASAVTTRSVAVTP